MAQAEERSRAIIVDDKIHTWPHLVRGEFLVMLFVLVAMTLWSLLVDAPLEEPANPARTPNPSKAPWYFLGLQEMLVYFDPWYAGVVLPTFIIIGLMVIPFIDINTKGNGYYTFKDRKWEIMTFILGFHILWVVTIIIGTFFRGPGVEPVLALAKVGSPQGGGPHQRRPALSGGSAGLLGHGRLRAVSGAVLLHFFGVAVLQVDHLGQGQGVHDPVGRRPVRDYGFSLRDHDGASGQDVSEAGVQHQVYYGHTLAQYLMFYVAKLLQALGIADVGYAVFVGIFQGIAMAEEIILTLIGVAVFSLGRLLESKTA